MWVGPASMVFCLDLVALLLVSSSLVPLSLSLSPLLAVNGWQEMFETPQLRPWAASHSSSLWVEDSFSFAHFASDSAC